MRIKKHAHVCAAIQVNTYCGLFSQTVNSCMTGTCVTCVCCMQLGCPQQKPKLVKLLCDVSGSMYRFNGQDGRLDRQLETVLMVMEAFESYEHKIKV